MDLLLQCLGGGFYLLNKIFLSVSERVLDRAGESATRRWRVAAWAVYLAGLPPWVIFFIGWRNWIAASVEASGAPAMVLGIIIALRGTTKDPPRWLDHLALICVPFGIGYSLYDFGGITTVNQWLEVGLVLGYLPGTYLLAKKRSVGYLFYVLMHVTCGWLMWIQGYPWLFLQQLVSLAFILDAFIVTQRRKSKIPPPSAISV